MELVKRFSMTLTLSTKNCKNHEQMHVDYKLCNSQHALLMLDRTQAFGVLLQHIDIFQGLKYWNQCWYRPITYCIKIGNIEVVLQQQNLIVLICKSSIRYFKIQYGIYHCQLKFKTLDFQYRRNQQFITDECLHTYDSPRIHILLGKNSCQQKQSIAIYFRTISPKNFAF